MWSLKKLIDVSKKGPLVDRKKQGLPEIGQIFMFARNTSQECSGNPNNRTIHYYYSFTIVTVIEGLRKA